MINRKSMELEQLVRELTDPIVTGSLDRRITSLGYDSRDAGPDSLFVAIRGHVVDGHSFIEQAIDRGAVAIVSEEPGLTQRVTHIQVPDSRDALARLAAAFYSNPSRQLRMIGITGTNGKTTTTYLIKHLLERPGQRTGLIGTVSYEIGERVLPASRTTPESLDLQSILAQCVDARCANVVMEVSSHALQLDRVDGISFRVAVFTNLTQDHLDFHRGMKEYFEAKAKLFAGLRDSDAKSRTAIINVDDAYGQQLIARFGRDVPIITFGMGKRKEFSSKAAVNREV